MLCTQNEISAYKYVWLYVMFDLPVETKRQRKNATLFRKNLLKDGFVMQQFSVYIRPCASYEAANVHIKRVGEIVPEEGFVSIVKVTDKQFGDAVNFVGKKSKPSPPAPVQLEFF